MILLVDNYDSFVYNLARYVRELGMEPVVVRNDAISTGEIAAMLPTHIILSPGPCTPAEAALGTRVVRELGARIPVLGVCLGHQSIGAAYGARIVPAVQPMHGRTSAIRHTSQGVLAGVPAPVRAARYHSLVIERETCPEELIVTAWSDDGDIMAVMHRTHPVHGVQFHPESAASEYGYHVIANFLAIGGVGGTETGAGTTRGAGHGSGAGIRPGGALSIHADLGRSTGREMLHGSRGNVHNGTPGDGVQPGGLPGARAPS